MLHVISNDLQTQNEIHDTPDDLQLHCFVEHFLQLHFGGNSSIVGYNICILAGIKQFSSIMYPNFKGSNCSIFDCNKLI